MFTILTKQNLIYKADEVYGTHFMTFAIPVSFTKLMKCIVLYVLCYTCFIYKANEVYCTHFMTFAIPVSCQK